MFITNNPLKEANPAHKLKPTGRPSEGIYVETAQKTNRKDCSRAQLGKSVISKGLLFQTVLIKPNPKTFITSLSI